ncbi:MAG: hypothetical protein ACF8QF_10480 [Phycisphaerales bacterium]
MLAHRRTEKGDALAKNLNRRVQVCIGAGSVLIAATAIGSAFAQRSAVAPIDSSVNALSIELTDRALRIVAHDELIAHATRLDDAGLFGHAGALLRTPTGSRIAIAAPTADALAPRSGRIYFFDIADGRRDAGEPAPLALEPCSAVLTIDGAEAGALLGSALAPAPDLDGDGFDDLLIGAPGTSRAHLVSGADG